MWKPAIDFKKVFLFLALTYGGNWLLAGLFFASGGKLDSPMFGPVAYLYMMIPAIMAIVVQKFIYRQPLKEELAISFKLNRWFVVAWLFPPVAALVTIGFNQLMPGTHVPLDLKFVATKFMWAVSLNTLASLLFAFGEELGWRGFLLHELLPLGFWRSSFLIGVIWAVWHFPFIIAGYNYPEHPFAGLFIFTVMCILLASVLAYLRLKAHSTVAAAIAHSAFNGSAFLAALGVSGGSDLLVGNCGLAGCLVLFLTSVLIFFDRRRSV